jgi:hypothetical protein
VKMRGEMGVRGFLLGSRVKMDDGCGGGADNL